MNKSILIVFVCACLLTYGVECKGGRGGRGGFGRGRGHSWGRGHGSGVGRSSWSSGSRHTYPSHNGLSGNSRYGSSGSAHNYPSGGGLSGHGTGYGGSHSYPPSTGLSGSNRGSTWGNSGYRGSGYTYNAYGHGYGYVPYTYHTAPQTVYIHQYRNTDSTYGDLLTGLALYNLGRSHSHHYHHYYEDDYYRRRYSSDGQQRPYDVSGEKAKCYLRISGDGKEQRLSIPCEIVSTVADETEKVALNTTEVECTNVTVAVNSAPLRNDNMHNSNLHLSFPSPPLDPINDPKIDRLLQTLNEMNGHTVSRPASESVSTSSTTETSIVLNYLFSYLTSTTQSTTEKNDVTSAPFTSTSPAVITTTDKPKTIIQTICKNNTVTQNVTATDPLTQRGRRVEVTSSMKCTVEIVTGVSVLRHRVDCKALEAYAKMPEPKKESALTPSRNTLKSWLDSPPWWLSMFIAV